MSSTPDLHDSPRAPLWERMPGLELLAWMLLWCVARGALVLSFGDVFGYGEEFEKACAGKAMIDGLGVPHYQLAYHYYEGGGFVISHLDALAFMMFGQSVLAIKLVALGFGAAILAASWRLCERLGGRGAARVFALLFVFAPESVQKNSLLALGIHFHALLFVALVLDAAAALILEPERTRRRWLWFGFTAGFGLFFSYQLVLTIVAAVIALVVALRHERMSKRMLRAAVGFAIGLAPLLWMAAHAGKEVFDIHGAEVLGGTAKLDTLQKFFASVFGGRGVLDWIALIALCASPALGWFALRESDERTLGIGAWLVLAHIVVFLFAYVASGFTVGRVYHYFLLHRLTPLWWLTAMLTTFGALAAWRTQRTPLRRLAVGAVAVLVLGGAIDTVRMLGDAPQGGWRDARWILARTKGYSYAQYLQKITPHLVGVRADKLKNCLRFTEEDPQLLHQAITVALYVEENPSLEDMERELDGVGVEDKRGFYLGYGMTLRNVLGGEMQSRVAEMEKQPEARREALLEAIGRFGTRFFPSEDLVRKELQESIEAKLPAAVMRGLGHRVHDAQGDAEVAHYFEMRRGPLSLDPQRVFELLAQYPSEPAGQVLVGYQSAHLLHWLDGRDSRD
jgi:4-amino-4-deoxy-L-arabinose transferase-like glycosyltransferase